ncbi:amino acid transporter [Colletotrichum higginsianum]|uniref:Amino acid transporter n=2 Tax=Colletotrichum destructivum species complex TaxID=2707350 RepID=H1W1V3_COLHI|nr:amino acid transporter [Colletotrichum higginsianum]
MMWFILIKEGKWYSKKNIFWSILNGLIFIMGLIVLVGGTYSCIKSIIDQYSAGTIKNAFSCALLI